MPGMSECELTNETKDAKAVMIMDGTTKFLLLILSKCCAAVTYLGKTNV